MAGSLKYFVYTGNDGFAFAILRDESNMEAINGTVGDYPDAGTVKYVLPRNIKPRYVEFGNTAGTIRRRIVCLTEAIFDAYLGGETFDDETSGETLRLVRKAGEVISLPKGIDTGLNDGDAS